VAKNQVKLSGAKSIDNNVLFFETTEDHKGYHQGTPNTFDTARKGRPCKIA
jgi:hypothetical protein